MCAKRTSGKAVFGLLSALLFLTALPALSTAQDNGADAYPSQAVRIIVGFTPGGAPDITARIIAEKLNEAWGRPVIVENRPGAGSALAARYVAESLADGYTLLSITNAHAVVPAINAEVPYDAVASFAGVTMTSMAPNWLLVSPSLGVRSLKDFIALAKEKPNQLNYGSAGLGSFMQFAAAMFNDAVGIQAQHVPYKGPPEAIADTAAGRVDYVLSPIGAALGLVRAGKVLPLAVTGNARLPEFPDVPTVEESGFPSFELYTWTALLAPAHTPPAVVAKLNTAIREILKDPDVQTKFKNISVEPIATTPADLEKRIADTVVEFTAAARKANILSR